MKAAVTILVVFGCNFVINSALPCSDKLRHITVGSVFGHAVAEFWLKFAKGIGRSRNLWCQRLVVVEHQCTGLMNAGICNIQWLNAVRDKI